MSNNEDYTVNLEERMIEIFERDDSDTCPRCNADYDDYGNCMCAQLDYYED